MKAGLLSRDQVGRIQVQTYGEIERERDREYRYTAEYKQKEENICKYK